MANQMHPIIILFLIPLQLSHALECEQVNKNQCDCFESENPALQCPPGDSQVSVSVSKKHHVELQCLKNSAPYLDLNVLPDLVVPQAELMEIDYCYLNTTFRNVLDKFGIENLKVLIFESIRQTNDERNNTFTKESFESLGELESLTLAYSDFYFPEDFLANTPNLLSVTLKDVGLKDVERYFRYTPRLKKLELSSNQIQTLHDGIFEDLTNLTRLFLFSNRLSSQSREVYRGLSNLGLLELSNNNITTLPEDTFTDLRALVNISLRGNHIRRIHTNTFTNNKLLENIRLSYNGEMMLEGPVFANLSELRSVELTYNKLQQLSDDTFLNCVKLETIALNKNALTTLPEGVFRGLKKLKVLDLSENLLSSLPDGIFSDLAALRELSIRHNQLSVIGDKLFRGLIGLKKLDLQRNAIFKIGERAFSACSDSLVFLDVSKNKLNNTGAFHDLRSVQEFTISYNNLDDLPFLESALSLKRMDVSHNKIDKLVMVQFAHIPQYDVTVDVSDNLITEIDFQLAEIIAAQNLNNTEPFSTTHTVKLSGNPIVCNCTNYDLIRFNRGQMENLKALVDLDQDNVNCSNMKSRVIDLIPSDIDCPVMDGCPVPCMCSYKPYNTAIIINCTDGNLTSYPEIDFQIDAHTYNQTFLVLSGNRLTMGPTIFEANYTNITNLDLSRNLISHMDWIPPKIKELNLNYNLLKNLDERFIAQLANATSLERLHLKGNPWDCKCKSLDLQKYLMQYYHKVNSSDVYCHDANQQLVKVSKLCKDSVFVSTVLPILMFMGMCVAIALAISLYYKTEIKIYLYAKNMCLWFVTEEELDKDKTYDVFISYSHQDEKFVVEHLLAELEHGDTPFKVCIHIRDWVPGEFIAQQVVNSVKDSRRTLVVLSNSFIDSVWGKVEFRTAHSEAIREGRARVIVVLFGDVDEDKLDDELKSYLRTNTYVKWGDKYFWNKLKYALPHAKNNFYERNKRHNKVMLKIDDKFDLVKNPPSPSNTSTPPITLDPSLLESRDLKMAPTTVFEGEAPLLVQRI